MRIKTIVRLLTIIMALCLWTNSLAKTAHQESTQNNNQITENVPETEDDGIEDIGLQPGDEAPKFALRTTEGDYRILSKWSGERLSRPASQPIRHVVIASFFATWCAPCMKELPHLQNLYEKYMGKDIKFFLIDITESTRSVEGYENSPKAGPFLKKKGITIPILIDIYGMAKKNYGVTTLPRLFVIDRYRKIRLTKKGFHKGEDFEGELAAIIDKLLMEGNEE